MTVGVFGAIVILIGASLLGVLGALVAIPVAAAIQIVVKDVWELRDEAQASSAGPIPPTPSSPGPT